MGFFEQIGDCIPQESDRGARNYDVFPGVNHNQINLPSGVEVLPLRLRGTLEAKQRSFCAINANFTFANFLEVYVKPARGFSMLHYAALDLRMAEFLKMQSRDNDFQVRAFSQRMIKLYEAENIKYGVVEFNQMVIFAASGSVLLNEEQLEEVKQICEDGLGMPGFGDAFETARKEVQEENWNEAQMYLEWMV